MEPAQRGSRRPLTGRKGADMDNSDTVRFERIAVVMAMHDEAAPVIAALGGMLGMRKGEIDRAKWEDIDWERGEVLVRGTKTDGSLAVLPLHSALREDPNAILVGEMRDLETMSIAMTAAEMGVLVMGTLHTNGAAATVDRVINAFPADKQEHVRNMLSTSLRGIVSQQLLRKKDGTGRVVALEILINTPAVGNLIRQGKLEQLETVMQSGAAAGMCTMDSSLMKLYDGGIISGEEAYLQALDKTKFEQFKDA